MEDILLNPGFLGLLTVVIPAFLGYAQYRKTSERKFYRSNLSMDEKKVRLLRYYQENYHRARMMMIQNNLGSVVDEHFPFDPPKDLMMEDYDDGNGET